MASKNLWGDLSGLEKVRSPRAILREQADQLTSATRSVLTGEVDDHSAKGDFVYELIVSVAALNGYRHSVLTIQHKLDLYPVWVRSSKPILNKNCSTEEELEGALAEVLSSAEVKRVLSHLISQIS